MLSVTELLVAALATWQVVEVWHHGSLFATRRATIESLIESGCAHWWEKHVICPFCLAMSVAILVIVLIIVGRASAGVLSVLNVACNLFVYGLAVARLANVGNDLTRHRCRTPKDEPESGSDTSE